MKNPLKILSRLLKGDDACVDIDKAFALELKADHLQKSGKSDKAKENYLEALEHQPDRIELIDKILAIHDNKKEDWTEEDFTLHVTLSMRRQEILDPTFKRINSRALPESEEIRELIRDLLKTKNQNDETQIVESIVSFGDMALYPLIDFILGLKNEETK